MNDNEVQTTPDNNPLEIDLYFPCTDLGNAERLSHRYGAILRFCWQRNKWLVWNGKHWAWDNGERINLFAQATVRGIYAEASGALDEERRKELAKHAIQSENCRRLVGMIDLARACNPRNCIEIDDLDKNHYLLNVENGTIDLRTGELKDHNPTDMITEILPINYNPSADSDEWETFLDRIFAHNTELISYTQRCLGYSITGDQSEQAFFFCYGNGFNGKSTLLNTCRLVLGNYATQIPPSAFMVDKSKHGGGPNEAISNLKNKRLVCSTEIEDGQRLSVTLVKAMTGGEAMWCEHKFERGYTFQPTHKLWLSGNHEPIITDTTNSIWFRLKKIPFTIQIPDSERKKGYAEKLASDHTEAILTWLVKGCAGWYGHHELGEPEAVRMAVVTYRNQQDILFDFLTECCVVNNDECMDQAILYKVYKAWAEENDVHIISKPNFTNRIKEKGIAPGRRGGNKAIWQGIRLLTENESVNQVNAVNDFTESSLYARACEETLVKTLNNDNPINTFPTNPCLQCGTDEPIIDENMAYKCRKCGRYYPLGKAAPIGVDK